MANRTEREIRSHLFVASNRLAKLNHESEFEIISIPQFIEELEGIIAIIGLARRDLQRIEDHKSQLSLDV